MSTRRVPLEKRKRTEISCDKCKSRKQKCHRATEEEDCSYCQNHGVQCVTTQIRKTRLYGSIEGLGERLTLLEGLVKALAPDANLSDANDMRRLSESLGVTQPHPSDDESTKRVPEEVVKQEEELRVDQQGQVQYIGPSSSFGFRAKLSTLFPCDGFAAPRKFLLFGQSAYDKTEELSRTDRGSLEVVEEDGSSLGPTPQDARSPGSVDGSVLDALVSTFFDRIHPDFPILHEASFYEAFEQWTTSPSTADPAWLCSLLCVLILARRVAPFQISQKHEQKWWRQVQGLLPACFFATSIPALQGLLLAALHLHNSSHRDACWNLTGAAVRIAFAIGLHRDGLKSPQTPLMRELRKQVWWVLYSFELMQVSSHDRPSAIAEGSFSVGSPRESILGAVRPPDYTTWSNRIAVMLARACRASKVCQTSEEAGPLSPTARLLRDLDEWKRALPPHLQLDVVDSIAPSSQRHVLLLHVQHHYAITLITRYALLSRATLLSKNRGDSLSPAVISISNTCIDSGRLMSQHLIKLESVQKFDCATWWDIYFTFSASLILGLDIICNLIENREEAAESRALLNAIAELCRRQQRSNISDTMQKWSMVTTDFNLMVEEFINSKRPDMRSPQNTLVVTASDSLHEQAVMHREPPHMPEGMPTNAGSVSGEVGHDPGYWSNRWTQLSYLDPQNADFWQEVHWDDIGGILLGDQHRGP